MPDLEPHSVPAASPQADDLAGAAGKVGVLLINLGTPERPDYWSVRRYLREFLSDRRMIELPALLWQPILQTVILTLRPARSARAYAKIWNRDTDESPQRHHTRLLAEKLDGAIGTNGRAIVVRWAMRYGTPTIGAGLSALQSLGCRRILLFALYPQYSATTTATAYDHAFRSLMSVRTQPPVRTVPAYFDRPAYLKAVSGTINRRLRDLETRPDKLILSFHGLPKSYCERGDPYDRHCAETVRRLAPLLDMAETDILMTFQSRFGPQTWLQPYTDDVVAELARAGAKRIAVATPGFACDCLETLEEIAIGTRDVFLGAGGEQFTFIPCLNDSEHALDMTRQLIEEELQGWL